MALMGVLVILFLLVIAGLLGYLVYQSSEEQQPPFDPQAELKAAARLHQIQRKLDVADLKHQQRQDALRLQRELHEIVRDDGE